MTSAKTSTAEDVVEHLRREDGDVERFAENVAQQNELGVPSRMIGPDEAAGLSRSRVAIAGYAPPAIARHRATQLNVLG